MTPHLHLAVFLCLVGSVFLGSISQAGADTRLGLLGSLESVKYERVILLLDSSVSIPQAVWANDITTLAENFVTGLPSDVEVALWSFSGRTKIEQPFTLDRKLLLAKVKSADHQQGSKNLADAFRLAAEVFRGKERTSALVLITDGSPDNITETIAAKPPVHITVAGFGAVELDNIKRLASNPDFAFVFPDARSIVNHLLRNEIKPNVLIKDITLLNTDDQVFARLEDITRLAIRITVVNLMLKDDIPAGTIIWFRSSSDVILPKRLTIQKPIKPDQARTFEIELELDAVRSILELPCSVSFELDTTNARNPIPLFARYDSFQLSTSFIKGLFLGWNFLPWPKAMGRTNTYRILLLGPPGSGKSTKINEAHFALDDHLTSIPTVAYACHTGKHCTTTIDVYPFTVRLGGQSRVLPIEWADSWGVDEDNMLGDSLDMLVKGHADGRDMVDALHRLGTEPRDGSATEADLLLLFSSINGPSDTVADKMRQAVQLAKARGMAVLLAVTHIDQVAQADRENKRQALMNLFGLTSEKVILTKHQRAGTRSCEVDKSTLHLLLRALEAIQQSRTNLLHAHRKACVAAADAEGVAEVDRILNVGAGSRVVAAVSNSGWIGLSAALGLTLLGSLYFRRSQNASNSNNKKNKKKTRRAERGDDDSPKGSGLKKKAGGSGKEKEDEQEEENKGDGEDKKEGNGNATEEEKKEGNNAVKQEKTKEEETAGEQQTNQPAPVANE